MKIFYSLLLLFTAQFVFSQQSIIKGKTIEEATGKSLPNVLISIKNTKLSTTSDSDGNFIIRNVAIGKYDLEFSAYTFETKIISDVEVINNETTTLTVSLSEKNNSLDEVVIKTVKAKTESIKSLLTMQKNSVRVSDGISAESIKRTPDKTTSDVLKRISGASIQDNKFVIIRGLNDRYNASYLNGAPLPSTESDRKAFSFDIFPANMLDNLVIYKTASPDLPGEFAGGVIEINTKATPDKNFQSISVGGGYNTITTGKNQLYAKGGSTDWLGIDNSRALPSYLSNANDFKALQNTNSESSKLQIAQYAKSFQTDWSLYNKNFSPNTSFQYTLGRYFKLQNDQSLGFVMSLSHTKTNNYNETERREYETAGVLTKNQLDQSYATQTLLGAIANISLKINANTNFSFKNLYSINAENKVIDRNGSLSQESDPLYIHSTARLFSSSKIYSGQLIGEHFLPISKIKINWVGSFNKVSRTIPNERRNTYTYTKFDDGTVSQPSAFFNNTISFDSPGVMYSSQSTEYLYSTKADISKKFKFSDNSNNEVKIGGFTQSRFRNFDARLLGYIPFSGLIGGVQYNGISTYSEPESTIFNASNIGIIGPKKSGLTLFDGTKGNDSYKADSKLNTAYIMLDNSYKKIRVVWGVRMENYAQNLNSKSDKGDPVTVNNSQTNFLPSVNLIVSATKTQNIRLSYSKTLNRPEFRELAPFLFYDIATKFNTSGDPKLKTADIQNVDFRYEIFPGKGQLFSLSVFYKDFKNPIELQALANNSNQYKNAKSGTNRGVELEYRTLLSSVFGSKETKLLDDLTLFTNVAVIRSKADISNLTTDAEDIPLQGQSPYVLNAGMQYMNKEYGWSSSLNLNRIGNRIAIHGNQTPSGGTPAYWEKSRTFLDFQLAKSFLKNKLEFKFNVQNILKQDLIFYQNNEKEKPTPKVTGFRSTINSIFTGDSQNKNGYASNDDVVWRTKFGQTFSLSLNYNF